MKDRGINLGLVQKFDTSARPRGIFKGFFGFRKMFWDYLNKLEVPFYDKCCVDAGDPDSVGLFPVRFNATSGGFERFDGTNWVSADDSVGSITTGLTAHSGGGQGSAVALSKGYNEVTTSAVAGDSVKLPAAVAGASVTVKNDGATDIDVFPATGDTIDDGSANAAIRVVAGTTVSFFAIDATNWESSTQALASSSFTSPGSNVTLAKAVVRNNSATAVNVTGAITAAQLGGGLITSTSAAGVTATLPTAALLATAIGATRGTIFEFVVDNSAGANTVTIAVNTGITVGTTALTGGDTLTVSTAQVVASFRLIFTSTTTAILRRIS